MFSLAKFTNTTSEIEIVKICRDTLKGLENDVFCHKTLKGQTTFQDLLVNKAKIKPCKIFLVLFTSNETTVELSTFLDGLTQWKFDGLTRWTNTFLSRKF